MLFKTIRNNNRLNDFPFYNLYNNISNLFDGFTYDTTDVLTEDIEIQIGSNEYRRIENKLIENKLSIKKRKISSFILANLIFFLLIHESLVISNFIAMKGYFLLKMLVNRNNIFYLIYFKNSNKKDNNNIIFIYENLLKN